MIELIVPAEWIFSGLCLYACLNHLYRATLGHRRTAHLSLAGMALSGFAYGVVTVSQFHAQQFPDWLRTAEQQYVIASIAFSLFALFAAQYAELRDRRGLYGVILFIFVAMLLSWTSEFGIFSVKATGMKLVALPWGESVPVPDGLLASPRLVFYDLPNYIVFVYVLYACWHLRRNGEAFAARALNTATAIALTAVLLNDLNTFFDFSPVMFPEFGFLAMIIMMGANLSANLVEGHYRAFVAAKTAVARLQFDEPIPMNLPPEEKIRLALKRGYIAECNESFARLRDRTVQDCVGRRLVDFTVADDPQNHKVYAQIAASNFQINDIETHGRDSAGNDRYYIGNYQAIFHRDHIVQVWVSQQEITGLKRAETVATESTERFQRLCEASFEGISISEKGRLIDANEQLARMLGYDLKEIIGHDTMEFVAPEWRGVVRQNIMSGHEGIFEHDAIRKDGSTFPVEVRARMMSQGGRWLRVTAVRDITAQRRAEEATRTLARAVWGTTGDAFFQTLVKQITLVLEADVACVAVPVHGAGQQLQTIAVWGNGNLIENFTCDIAGTPCEEVVAGRQRIIVTGVRKAFPNQHLLEEWGIDGFAGIPLVDDTGTTIGLIAVMFRNPVTDASLTESALKIAASRATAELERKKAEAELSQLNKELERRVEQRTEELMAVNRELEAFSYSVSHDLRAPLRNISGFTELLRKDVGELSAEGSGFLSIIVKEVSRMAALIDDLLELSHISRTEMLMLTFDPAPLAQDVRTQFQMETQNRQVSWQIDILPSVTADRRMIRQVFANLMGNALKYTRPRDHAFIHIGFVAEQSNEKESVFFVKDNGVGFDMQYYGKLFGVFQRLHSARQFEGTGIGLANVQRIIHRHGGRVWAEGKVDDGATFYFSLPATVSNGRAK
jgi:PAS domain S-box-containing protein